MARNRKSMWGRSVSVSQLPPPRDLRLAANSHERSRQRAVMNVIVHMYIMAGMWVIPKGEVLSSSGAKLQHFKGSKKDNTNAAHSVPCQILIGGGKQTPQELSEQKRPNFKGEIYHSFMDTETLPVNYNKADKLAEDKGLSDAFLQACQLAVRKAQQCKSFRMSLYPDVMVCYELYKSNALTSFERAINHLEAKIASTTIAAENDISIEQITILEYYIDALENSSGELETFMLINPEEVIESYRQ